ncbi:Periplasmic binding protein [Desulfosarcina cetonica]|nr:Periplasmic binding protein [Desulfosarcina cetonica]
MPKPIRILMTVAVVVMAAMTTTPVAATPTHPLTRTITDMAGRKVQVPVTIHTVLATAPPPTTFVYMLAPDKLGGWLGRISKNDTQFIPKAYRDLPTFGWGRRAMNYEAYIAARPDLVFAGCEPGMDPSRAELTQAKMGTIPVVCVDDTRNAVGYAPTLRFIGNLLGVADRAEVLIRYYETVLDEVRRKVATIAEKDRVRVYYAEGNNGLSTDPSGSPHAQLIDVCGGLNVADCQLAAGSGMTPVTLESVLMWRPEVIITTSQAFAMHAAGNASWQKTPAVKNRRVHLTPSQPFNWFDRPPGVNRIVGIPWTARILYPTLFSQAWLEGKVREFYSLYYHHTLSEAELGSLLGF